jgi:uncharacterized protein
MFQKMDRWSRWSVGLMLCLSPLLLNGLLHLPIGSASVHQWLPDNFPEKDRYTRFQNNFGNDQFLIISWQGCSLEDTRLADFQTALLSFPPDQNQLVETVQTTNDVLRSLTDPPVSISFKQASARLRGILLGSDGTASMIVILTEYGLSHQAEAMTFIYQHADNIPGLGRDALRVAGTVYESYAVDQAAEKSLKKLVAPSCLIGILLSWYCLRSIRAAIAVLTIAGVGQLLAISTVYYSGGKFSAVLIVLPTLVFMLTLSGAVHLMNYYRDVSVGHNDHLGSRAMLLGFKPSLLSSITTSLGMASLATSQLLPIREFGLYSAVSLSAATIFLLLGFPFISDLLCGKHGLGQRKSVELAPLDTPFVAQYVQLIERKAILISGIGFAILGVSFWGLLYLKSSTQFVELFPRDSPTVRDLSFIEKHIGPVSSVEVLLEFPFGPQDDVLSQAFCLEKVAEEVLQLPEVGAVVSGSSFLPVLPKSSKIRDVARRAIMRRELANAIPKLKEQKWVAQTKSGTIWRLTAKVSVLTIDDYGSVTQNVQGAIDRALANFAPEAKPKVELTGLSPVMHDTQKMLLRDLGASFTTAFVLITPVMMLIARGFRAGLLIMIPNVLPETLVFGSMALLGFRLDIAGLLTASVAMGIAVNDTLHFVNWYANRLSVGDSRKNAIIDTMSNCAIAMIHTMLISCLSMLPFMFSDFVPTKQFACLMIAMIGSSILGDLVLLPALLLSRLGRCLIPSTRPRATAD